MLAFSNIQLPISSGAEAGALSKYGHTALEEAEVGGHAGAAGLLRAWPLETSDDEELLNKGDFHSLRMHVCLISKRQQMD